MLRELLKKMKRINRNNYELYGSLLKKVLLARESKQN